MKTKFAFIFISLSIACMASAAETEYYVRCGGGNGNTRFSLGACVKSGAKDLNYQACQERPNEPVYLTITTAGGQMRQYPIPSEVLGYSSNFNEEISLQLNTRNNNSGYVLNLNYAGGDTPGTKTLKFKMPEYGFELIVPAIRCEFTPKDQADSQQPPPPASSNPAPLPSQRK